MKFGLVTSVYANYAIDDVIPRVAAAGYDTIDIWGGRPHVYRHDYSHPALIDLRKRIVDEGLSVSSFLPAFYRYPHNLCSPNEVIRQDTLDYVRKCADNAQVLGAAYLLICPARLLNGQSHADGWQRLADCLNAICEYVSTYPLKVMLEPVNAAVFDLINTSAEAMEMLRQVGRDNLGVVLDTGHLHLSPETIDQALSRVANRLFMVHVNDNDGKKQQNLIPGDGTFDFPAFLSALKRYGYTGVISAELSGEYAPDIDRAVRTSLQRLREWSEQA